MDARPFDDSDTPEHLWSRSSTRLGVIAMGLCMAGPCTFGMSYWLALPASLLALWFAREAYLNAVPDSATRAYAKVGIVTSATALAFSAVYFVMVASWMAMWFGLIVLEGL